MAPTGARVFQIALLGSLAVHATMLAATWPNLARRHRAAEPSHKLMIASATLAEERQMPAMLSSPASGGPAMRAAQQLPPTGLDAPATAPIQRPDVPLPVPDLSDMQERPHKPAVPAVIDLSNLSVELQQQPAYAEYFRKIRERIRHHAQRGFAAVAHGGEVYVSFVLRNDGALQGVALDQERSSDDAELCRISQESITQAAPFPPFPEGFQRPAVTFRIVIDYELQSLVAH